MLLTFYLLFIGLHVSEALRALVVACYAALLCLPRSAAVHHGGSTYNYSIYCSGQCAHQSSRFNPTVLSNI
ncbi:hypothetical protein SRHO_G00074310 [Serrasalmus rhombeus]